jgi:putative transposase
LKREHGVKDNHKRIERVYREERLTLPRKRRKRPSWVVREPVEVPTAINERWSMVRARRHGGPAQVKVLTIVDDFSKYSPRIEAASSITGRRVVEILEELAQSHALPKEIVVDNGPEFRSVALDQWAYERGVKLWFIEPVKPAQNCFIESFNGKLRYECLDLNWFRNVAHTQKEIEKWWDEYNTYRPHSSLGGMTPEEFVRRQSEAGCQLAVGS